MIQHTMGSLHMCPFCVADMSYDSMHLMEHVSIYDMHMQVDMHCVYIYMHMHVCTICICVHVSIINIYIYIYVICEYMICVYI